jgi:hypothetical protein
MPIKKTRVNKTKEQIANDIKQKQKIERMVALVKLMWPFLENQEKIYDAQTALNALGGYIELGLKLKEDETTVGSLGIDLSKEDDSLIKTSMLHLIGLTEKEPARDIVTLTKKLADMLGQYGANEFLKGPMSKIKVTDIVK